MTEPHLHPEIGQKREPPDILCAKCKEISPHGSNVCGHCGSHLYVSCHYCGHRNQRALSRCTHCGHRLHRALWRRLRKRLFPENRKLRPLHLVLLVIVVWVGYRLIVKLSEFRLTPIG